MEMCHENIAMSPTATRPLRDQAIAGGACHTISVWLVDDDNEIREVMADLLNRQVQMVCPRQFSTSEAALAALTTETPPDALLLDINLGKKSGLDAIRPIKSCAPATHVLMFTTFFDRELECRALEAGASGFLLKSYDVQEIVRLIIAATEGREGAGLFSSWSRQPRIKSQTSSSVAAPKMPRNVPVPKPPGFIRAFFAALPQSRT